MNPYCRLLLSPLLATIILSACGQSNTVRIEPSHNVDAAASPEPARYLDGYERLGLANNHDSHLVNSWDIE